MKGRKIRVDPGQSWREVAARFVDKPKRKASKPRGVLVYVSRDEGTDTIEVHLMKPARYTRYDGNTVYYAPGGTHQSEYGFIALCGKYQRRALPGLKLAEGECRRIRIAWGAV